LAYSSSTRVVGARIVIVAHYGCIDAACSSSTRGCGANRSSITTNWSVSTIAIGRVAGIVSTQAVVVAHNCRIVATCHSIACLDGAVVTIIAWYGNVLTCSSSARIVGAHIVIVAHHRCKDAASSWATAGEDARVTTGAINGDVRANTIRARIIGARVVVIAIDGSRKDARSILGSADHRKAQVSDVTGHNHRSGALAAVRNGGVLTLASFVIARTNYTAIPSAAINSFGVTADTCTAEIVIAGISIIASNVGVDTASQSPTSIVRASVVVVTADRRE